MRRAVREFEAGRGLSTVVLENGRLIGVVSFVEPSREHACTNIGYWVAEDAQGRGIMTRAVAAMVDRAFHEWGFELLAGDPRPWHRGAGAARR